MPSDPPDEAQPSRLRQFWKSRGRPGQIGIIVAAIFLSLVVVALAIPAPDDSHEPAVEAVEDAEASPEPATTEAAEAETTTAAEEQEAPPPPPPRVARIIDGDTLELRNGDTIRLVQIDAPETNGECYATQSTKALRSLLPRGAEVRLESDPRLDNRDRYGRLLRYLFREGQSVNLALVKQGAASVWFYQGDRGRYWRELKRAADNAQAKERGAWGACQASGNYLTAWRVRQKPEQKPAQPASNCHPSYKGACLDPTASDYDCAGGSGDGPKYTGFVRVVGYDEYDLDADSDGSGCE
jgi:endonuclease YncB( thermonuclease family)